MPYIRIDDRHFEMICHQAGLDPRTANFIELEAFVVTSAFCVRAREDLLSDLNRIGEALAVPEHVQHAAAISDLVDGCIARAIELRGGPRAPILDHLSRDDDEHGDVDAGIASSADEPVAPPGARHAEPLPPFVGPTVWSRLKHPEV
jgi:hypothetical protein